MSRPYPVVANETFVDQTIPVDDVLYQGCQFTRCRIVFQGTGHAHFETCVFNECQWVFDNGADNTLQYLAYLYRVLGPGGPDLVESIFASLRQGGVGHGALAYLPSSALR